MWEEAFVSVWERPGSSDKPLSRGLRILNRPQSSSNRPLYGEVPINSPYPFWVGPCTVPTLNKAKELAQQLEKEKGKGPVKGDPSRGQK